MAGVEIGDDVLARAFRSRDRRFEGRFVAAVATTGVYCRPGCPAPLPKEGHVRFFPTPAAAEVAGFRACRRCRPDAVAGVPFLLGTGTTVSRALRLICGEAPNGGIERLADRLGVGSRHLRRLFEEHLGTSPLAVLRTHRAHFARRLLDETRLPVTDVASASGFASLRSFHRAIRRSFGATPLQLRRRGGSGSRGPEGESLVVTLPYRPPFDWEGITAFLALRAIPGVEEVRDGVWRRTVRTAAGTGLVEVKPVEGRSAVAAAIPARLAPHLLALAARVARTFDLDADPAEIREVLGRDSRLAPLVARWPGARVPGGWDPFETGVRVILGQQVTVRGASTLAGRIARLYGEPLAGAGAEGPSLLFPQASALAGADLEAVGLPGARARTIRAFAALVADGRIDLEGPLGGAELTRALGEVPGIGPWTLEVLAMRAFGEPDAFPASDLSVRRALADEGKLPSPASLARRAEAWRPWRAYATILLWASEKGRR